MHCLECAGQSKSDAVLAVSGTFCVHGKLEIPPVPGWIVIAPRTHVTQYDELPIGAQNELGTLIGQVSAALRACTPTEKIYVCVFAELVEHLHVHVIARPPGYAIKGPAIFSAPAGDRQAFDEVTAKVIQSLL